MLVQIFNRPWPVFRARAEWAWRGPIGYHFGDFARPTGVWEQVHE